MVVRDSDNTLLLDHVTGALPPALDVMMASYVAMNGEAQSKFSALSAMGGALLEDMDDDVGVSSDALDVILDKIAEKGASSQTASRSVADSFDTRTKAVVPAPLRAMLPTSLDQLDWKARGAGVREFILPLGKSKLRASLLSIAPGKTIPHHTHKGREYTLVLDGAYTDEGGRVAAGDFIVNDCDDEHKPIADDKIGCLCFAVTDAPLQFSGPLGWIINPFLRH